MLAVRAALAHPAMMHMSNREIADEVGVDHKTVAAHRQPGKFPTTSQPTVTPQHTTPSYPQIAQNVVTEPKPHKAVVDGDHGGTRP